MHGLTLASTALQNILYYKKNILRSCRKEFAQQHIFTIRSENTKRATSGEDPQSSLIVAVRGFGCKWAHERTEADK